MTGGKIPEMNVPALKRKLLASQEAGSAANAVVLARAYQGRLTLSTDTKWTDQGSIWSKAA